MNTKKTFNRKVELIKRDPVYKDLVNALKSLKESKKKSAILIDQCIVRDPVFEEINQYYSNPLSSEELKKQHQKKYPHHWDIVRLKAELAYKWHVFISMDISNSELSFESYLSDDVIFVGSPPLFQGYKGVMISDFNKYPLLYWTPQPNPFDKKPELADINEFTTPGYNKTGYKYVPIIINVSKLNKSDAKWVKREIWKIIDNQLDKGQNKKPYGEQEECAFLYHLRNEKTFQNYLRWYDIHVQEKLSFRLIAVAELIRKENISKAEEFLNKFFHKKVKWGNPVKGEDRIEKGVKLIYTAIHRKPYVQKEIEPIIEEYNCPQHGNNCMPTCDYFKDWYGRFNRLNKST